MKKGFTLAEVLITLAIIGVVAALTMSSVVNNARNHGYEVGVKKFYSNMSRVIRKYMVDEGTYDLRNTGIGSSNDEIRQTAFDNFVKKYFHVTKECDASDIDKCFASKFKNLSGNTFDIDTLMNGAGASKAYVLGDGTVFMLQSMGPIYIAIDVNGKRGPNTLGYDMWNMDIFYDGSIDENEVTPQIKRAGEAHETRRRRFEDQCMGGGYGGCFGHLLENGFKIDY